MCEFSTESRARWFSIFVDEGEVTAVVVSDDTRGRRYVRTDKDMNTAFFRAAKALAAEVPEDFQKMKKLIEKDYTFWMLAQEALLELIRDLKKILDWTKKWPVKTICFNWRSFFHFIINSNGAITEQVCEKNIYKVRLFLYNLIYCFYFNMRF